jgi:hypothetical protein
MQTALNRDGMLPFEYPGVQAGEDLDALAESLRRLEKKTFYVKSYTWERKKQGERE